jgi:putative colanic acid biosynthesis glycosyltransferase
MNGPILSIITVNFNNNLGLLKTLESVSSQSFSSYEHIIIDAGSTDGSRETIIQYEKENPHLSFWSSEPDKGIYDGMNKGIDHAKGQYLYFLNSGDCLSQDILAKIPFDGTEYLYGDTILFYKRKTKKRVYPDTLDLIYLSDNSLHHQSCFIRRNLPKFLTQLQGVHDDVEREFKELRAQYEDKGKETEKQEIGQNEKLQLWKDLKDAFDAYDLNAMEEV